MHRVAADISDPDAAARLIDETVSRFGGLDILVNNTGVLRMGGVEEVSLADYDTVFGVNVKGMFLCARAAASHLKRSAKENGDAAIVNVSSASGLGADYGMIAYNASKGAVNLLTKRWRWSSAGTACARTPLRQASP